MSSTLLAHLARRLGTGEEDLATEALAYILRNPAAGSALASHGRRWQRDLPEILTWRTQEWDAGDSAVPDLVGVDAAGTTPLVVEAKFGAALTPNQPVTYLHRLLGGTGPGVLLFLVPRSRRASLWSEIIRRCDEAELAVTTLDGSRFVAEFGHVAVGITTWEDVLDEVERGLTPPGEHRQTLAELEQLRGVCTRASDRLFTPFTSEFLTGDTGRRLEALDTILNEAVDNLVAAGKANTKGLQRSGSTSWFGRYVRIAGWSCLLHVNYYRWGRQRQTPLWLRISDPAADGNQELLAVLSTLEREHPSRFLNEDGRRQIPIFIPHGVDRDGVAAAVDAQLVEIHDLLTLSPAGE